MFQSNLIFSIHSAVVIFFFQANQYLGDRWPIDKDHENDIHSSTHCCGHSCYLVVVVILATAFAVAINLNSIIILEKEYTRLASERDITPIEKGECYFDLNQQVSPTSSSLSVIFYRAYFHVLLCLN